MPYTIIIQGIWNHDFGNYLGPYSNNSPRGSGKDKMQWTLVDPVNIRAPDYPMGAAPELKLLRSELAGHSQLCHGGAGSLNVDGASLGPQDSAEPEHAQEAHQNLQPHGAPRRLGLLRHHKWGQGHPWHLRQGCQLLLKCRDQQLAHIPLRLHLLDAFLEFLGPLMCLQLRQLRLQAKEQGCLSYRYDHPASPSIQYYAMTNPNPQQSAVPSAWG